MAHCNCDPRLTIVQANELGYCENCNECQQDDTESTQELDNFTYRNT